MLSLIFLGARLLGIVNTRYDWVIFSLLYIGDATMLRLLYSLLTRKKEPRQGPPPPPPSAQAKKIVKQKGLVYWIGLILITASIVGLFGIFWFTTVIYHNLQPDFLKGLVPVIVACFAFLLLGSHMVSSGITEEEK